MQPDQTLRKGQIVYIEWVDSITQEGWIPEQEAQLGYIKSAGATDCTGPQPGRGRGGDYLRLGTRSRAAGHSNGILLSARAADRGT